AKTAELAVAGPRDRVLWGAPRGALRGVKKMRKSALVVIAVAGAILAGCGQTVPVVVIGKDGRTLKGSNTVSLDGTGSFSVSDGKLTCAGTYNAYDMSQVISMSATCSDGRKGIVT